MDHLRPTVDRKARADLHNHPAVHGDGISQPAKLRAAPRSMVTTDLCALDQIAISLAFQGSLSTLVRPAPRAFGMQFHVSPPPQPARHYAAGPPANSVTIRLPPRSRDWGRNVRRNAGPASIHQIDSGRRRKRVGGSSPSRSGSVCARGDGLQTRRARALCRTSGRW